MIIEQTLKYKVSIEELPDLLSKLKNMEAKIIMDNKLMIRTLFKHKNQKQRTWVRIRVGDVTPYGEEVCVITFKKRINALFKQEAAVLHLQVEDYDSAIELFEEIGLTKQSVQENRRTKYLCDYNDNKYLISIDEWPLLDKIRFVTVQSLSTIEHETLIDFANTLNLIIQKKHRGGVDSIYKKEYGFAITEKPLVNFDSTIESLRE